MVRIFHLRHAQSQDKLSVMLSRRFLLLAALCVLTADACAQTTPPGVVPPAVPHPSPFGVPGSVQLAPSGTNKRVFTLTLRSIPAPLMAFWLDPKHHQPPYLARRSPLTDFSLPKGIDRIIPLEPQKALLVFGTADAVELLQWVINRIDKPQNLTALPTIAPLSTRASVIFASSVYWIDSVSPQKSLFQKTTLIPHLAKESELNALADLMEQDRAIDSPLPTVMGTSGSLTVLPFSRTALVAMSPYALTDPRSDIDPGIYAGQFNPRPFRQKDSVTMLPLLAKNGDLTIWVSGIGARSTPLLPKGDGTILLGGTAKDWGIEPPSARFDTFVLIVQPRIQIDTYPVQ